jgi:hypothetical protein
MSDLNWINVISILGSIGVGALTTYTVFAKKFGKYEQIIDRLSSDQQELTKKMGIAEKNIASIQQWCAHADQRSEIK